MCVIIAISGGTVRASEPVDGWDGPSAEQVAAGIDQRVQASWSEKNIAAAEIVSDREFVRRVYLDLMGRIPRVDEANAFVRDVRADKRRRLVFALTESEDWVQHFADTFDTLLMGRGTAGNYGERSKHGWRDYLERAFRENRPWNEIVHEILVARPVSDDQHGSDWFLYEREDKHQVIAEAIAPAVFGIRVECAQCHDHPLADEILQAHYWGLVAFFNRSKNTKSKKGPRVGESAIGGFSEFADLTGDSKPNLLTFLAAPTIDEARPEKDVKEEEQDSLYQPAGVEGDPRVPLFSRRQRFADQVAASHPLVARAMVNRIWAMLMGRGIVHPFDEMDSVHQPSHPELLDFLSEDFRQSRYDVRRMVRGIALSEPYQLSSLRPDQLDDPSTFAWYLERPLTAEQLARSIQLAVRGEFRNDDPLVSQIRDRITEVMPEESVTTIKEALFLTNGPSINQFIEASDDPSHLPSRLARLDSNSQVADQLFNVIFCREPSREEVDAVAEYLGAEPDDRQQRFPSLIWSMLTSAEFRFNH